MSTDDKAGERCPKCGATPIDACTLSIRSQCPRERADDKTVPNYGCGTFDAQGLCDNCQKKISDLNDGRALCPFGKYPQSDKSERTYAMAHALTIIESGGLSSDTWNLAKEFIAIERELAEVKTLMQPGQIDAVMQGIRQRDEEIKQLRSARSAILPHCPQCGSMNVHSRRVDECFGGCKWSQTGPLYERDLSASGADALDAKRYRWLRDQGAEFAEKGAPHIAFRDKASGATPPVWLDIADRMVDKAMSEYVQDEVK
jgi:hypothetical protein